MCYCRWNESSSPADSNERFIRAVALTGSEFLQKIEYLAEAWWPARAIVERCFTSRFDVHPSGSIVVLDHFCPWKEHLFEIEEEVSRGMNEEDERCWSCRSISFKIFLWCRVVVISVESDWNCAVCAIWRQRWKLENPGDRAVGVLFRVTISLHRLYRRIPLVLSLAKSFQRSGEESATRLSRIWWDVRVPFSFMPLGLSEAMPHRRVRSPWPSR